MDLDDDDGDGDGDGDGDDDDDDDDDDDGLSFFKHLSSFWEPPHPGWFSHQDSVGGPQLGVVASHRTITSIKIPYAPCMEHLPTFE